METSKGHCAFYMALQVIYVINQKCALHDSRDQIKMQLNAMD